MTERRNPRNSYRSGGKRITDIATDFESGRDVSAERMSILHSEILSGSPVSKTIYVRALGDKSSIDSTGYFRTRA